MKSYFYAFILISLLLAMAAGQEQASPDLIFQSDVTPAYKLYLSEKEAEYDGTLSSPMNNANTMKAYMGKAMINMAWIPVLADSQINELEPVVDDIGISIDSVDAIIRDEIQPIRSDDVNNFLIDLRELFLDPRYGNIKDRITNVVEKFQSSFDTTGIILESFFDDSRNHLELFGDNLGAIIDSSAEFTFRFKITGIGKDDSIFVIQRNNLEQVDSVIVTIENAGDAFDRAVMLMDSVLNMGGEDVSQAIAKFRETADHLDHAFDQIGDVLTTQPSAVMEIDTSFIRRFKNSLSEADTILAGKSYELGKEDKTIRPVAILENAPAGLENLLLDYYRVPLAERGSYTFGNLFPLGLPGDVLDGLNENMIINDSDDPDAFAARMRYYRDLYLADLVSDSTDESANLAVAITKTYLLLYDHLDDIEEFIDYMKTGDYRDFPDRYDWNSFSYPATTDSIKNHFNKARVHDGPVLVMLIKTSQEPDNPYTITEQSDFIPNYIFGFQLDFINELVNTLVEARNGIANAFDHLYGELEKMFDMTLDPNLLDFSQCESFYDFLLVLQNSNPHYLSITEYGVEQFTKAGDDIRELFGDLSETTHNLNQLILAMADHEDDLGIDGQTWTSFSGEINDLTNEIKVDFEEPDSTTFIGERVNLSAWFDNPPDSLLQKLIWFSDNDEMTDNTLGGLFPDRVTAENEIRGPIRVPLEFMLAQNYPNPFNPVTTIEYTLPAAAKVELKLYNITGQEIATLVNAYQKEGQYTVTLKGSGLATGIYFYRLRAGTYVDAKRCIVIK